MTAPLLDREARRALVEGESTLDGIDHVDPDHSDRLAAYAALYVRNRPSVSEKVAQRLARKPLFYAGMMVAAGDADAMVAGVASASRRLRE